MIAGVPEGRADAGYSITGRRYQGFLILFPAAISPIPLGMKNEAFALDLMRLQEALAGGESLPGPACGCSAN